jgi:hypothetical protein
MLYRAAMIGIVAFWLVMMALLVRLETHPETTDILDVPVSYVLRIMFRHGQRSLLTVRDETKSVGTVELSPSTTGSDGRLLDFSGTLTIPLALGTPQQFSFNGAVNMDATLRVRDFHVDVSARQPRGHLRVAGDTARKTLTYEVTQGDRRLGARTVGMEALGATVLQNLGINGNLLQIGAAAIPAAAVTARETEIGLRGEQLEVYDVSVAEGTGPALDFYVTELGQIVQAKTNFGYSLSAEDWQ